MRTLLIFPRHPAGLDLAPGHSERIRRRLPWLHRASPSATLHETVVNGDSRLFKPERVVNNNQSHRISACFLAVGRGHSPACMASAETPILDLYKLMAWFEANRKQATWGAAGVALVVMIIGFVVWQRDEKE